MRYTSQSIKKTIQLTFERLQRRWLELPLSLPAAFLVGVGSSSISEIGSTSSCSEMVLRERRATLRVIFGGGMNSALPCVVLAAK